MKKNLFILAVAGLALASCSNDETVNSLATSGANEISFRPLMTGITRAADANLATNGFRVTSFETGTTTTPYFANVDFTNNGGNYTSTTKYYWPNTYNLDFYAWSPGTLSSNYASIPVTPGTTIASQTDLVFAKAANWGKVGGNNGSTGVTINFRHAESKIAVQLKNTNSNLFFTVKDVKIGYLADAGTFAYTAANSGETSGQNTGNLSNLDWTPANNHNGVYQLNDVASTSYNVAAAAQAGGEMILIPQTLTAATVYSGTTAHNWSTGTEGSPFNGAYIMVEYKVQNTNSSGAYIVGAADNTGSPSNPEYIKAIWPLTAIQWVPGYKYTYTVDLAGGGYYADNNDDNTDLDPVLEGSEIMFATVTVDAWDNADVLIVQAGSTQTVSVPNKYASNPYKIIVNGLTTGSTVNATGTYNFTGTPTVSDSGTVPTSGIIEISGALSANTDSEVQSVVTITESGNGSTVTTITITQQPAS